MSTCDKVARLKFVLSNGREYFTCASRHADNLIDLIHDNYTTVTIYEMKCTRKKGKIIENTRTHILAHKDITTTEAKTIQLWCDKSMGELPIHFLKFKNDIIDIGQLIKGLRYDGVDNVEFIDNVKNALHELNIYMRDYSGMYDNNKREKEYNNSIPYAYMQIAAMIEICYTDIQYKLDALINISKNMIECNTNKSIYIHVTTIFKHLSSEFKHLLRLHTLITNRIHYRLSWDKTSSLSKQCSICMEKVVKKMKNGGMITCKHAFHNICILKWLLTKNDNKQCPLCRKPVENWESNFRYII
jgi:hypothetical protein